MRKGLWTKGIVLVNVFFLIFVTMNISTATETSTMINNEQQKSLFGLQSIISVSWNSSQTSEPLVPNGAAQDITLDVSYCVVHGIFGRIILWYYLVTLERVTVTIEIVDKPDYCSADLSNSQLSFLIDDEITVGQTKLVVSVNQYAPAFEPFNIQLKASVDSVFGPFGFLPFIDGDQQIFNLSLMADYFPLLDVTPEYNYLETTPGTMVIDPITVENLGNGKTLVDTQIINLPSGWIAIISPAQLAIDVNESEMTNVSITPPWDFYGEGTITLSFTPKYYYNQAHQGTPVYIQIIVEVKP